MRDPNVKRIANINIDDKQFLRQLRKWIKALDSGKYMQGLSALQHLSPDNKESFFCCLGVACKVLIPKKQLHTVLNDIIFGGFPDDQANAPKWLKQVNDDFEVRTKRGSMGRDMALSILNDSYGFTFTEIATMLEFVYIHKAFE